MMQEGMTEKQRKYLFAILEERNLDYKDIEKVITNAIGISFKDLSKEDASTLIDGIVDHKVTEATQAIIVRHQNHKESTEPDQKYSEASVSEVSSKSLPGVIYGWNQDDIELIRNTVAKGATDTEFKFYLYQCQKYGLDPLLKEMWLVKFGNEPASIFAAHAGMLKKVVQSGFFDGMDTKITWKNGGESRKDKESDPDIPFTAECTVYRKNVSVPMHFIAYFSTFARKKKDGRLLWNWETMPEIMLQKCAEANALRKMFPEVLGSLYTREEMPYAERVD